MRYDKRSATFPDDHVSLSTVNGRITTAYVLPLEGDNPQTTYLCNDDYEVTDATLQYRDAPDTFYLHVGTKVDAESERPDDSDAEHSTVLGVDFGIEQMPSRRWDVLERWLPEPPTTEYERARG